MWAFFLSKQMQRLIFDQTNRKYILLLLMLHRDWKTEAAAVGGGAIKTRCCGEEKLISLKWCSLVFVFFATHDSLGTLHLNPTLFIRISITPAIMSEVEDGGSASVLCSPLELPALAIGGKKTQKKNHWCVANSLGPVQIRFSRLHCAVHGEEDVDWRGRCSKCCLLCWFF